MSIRIMNRVWEDSQQSGGSLLALLAMADNADHNGICWPGTEYLARKARMSERQVQRIIDSLIKDGEILILKPAAGRGKRTVYKIVVKDDKLSTFISGKGDIGGAERVTSETPSIKKEPSLETSKARRRKLSDEEFIGALKTNPAYAHINLDAELGKMQAWLLARPGRQLTRSFIVNWLNKEQPPVKLNGTHQKPVTESSRNIGTANEGKSSQYKGVGRLPVVRNA